MKRTLTYSLAVAAVMAAAGCSGDTPTDPDPEPVVNTVSEYMQDLPDWEVFSPQLSPQPATPLGNPVSQAPEVLDVEVVNDDGDIEILENVTYECQAQPFTLTDNPKQIAIYSPDIELLWPGALIQGKSHRDGNGSLLGLTVAERTPIEVSIPTLANDDNFRVVDSPSQASVEQARGSMIGAATVSGLATPSTIVFEESVYHSEQQFALELGMSGRYLGFEASAQGSVQENASKTTVTAQFYQKMYDVVVAPPQTPDGFFSDDFTSEKLQTQVDLGRIGPDNLPVYVSNVVYGRMMMFSLTSTASEDDIRATLKVAYEGIGSGGSANLSTKQKKILEQSEIRVTSYGGKAEATLAVIRSGNWADYFTDSAELSSAAPLSYTFRNLGDGSIASVSESTEYNIKSCTATAATPGTFNFTELQSLSLPIGVPANVMMGDIDGDGDDDIIWNHVAPGTNETVVGVSNGDGTFSMSSVFVHSTMPENGWSEYVVKTGDFNNDGMIDLAWNRTNGTNRTYVGLSNGDGSLTEMPVFTRVSSWGTGWDFEVGNVDGIDGDDLVWNARGGNNRTYVSPSNGDGTFGVNNQDGTGGKFHDHPATAWTGNEAFAVADVNGDGRDDMIWYTLGTNHHHVYVGETVSDVQGSMFSFHGLLNRGNGWADYQVVVGNVDGVAGADLVWVADERATNPVHKDLSTGGAPPLAAGPLQSPVAEDEGPFTIRLLDVNGDGRMDLLLNSMESVNRSFIGLGTSTGEFDFGRVSQDHPSIDDWSQFSILVGDVNGDNRDDVIYNNADASNDVYVGIAKE